MKNVYAHAAQGFYRRLEEEYYGDVQKDYFVGYSIFKVLPVCLQEAEYDEGYYNTEAEKTAHANDFEKFYAVMKNLDRLTEINDDTDNNLLMIENDITHAPMELQLPEYEPAKIVDNTGLEQGYRETSGGDRIDFKEETQMTHYHVNMAAMLQMAKWLDYLKQKGVYDNTKIIIVADHGISLRLFDDMIMDDIAKDDKSFDVCRVNPLLLVKDFNSTGDITQCDGFMTNADVPSIAVKETIEDPTNPYTGNEISDGEKTAHDQMVTNTKNGDILKNTGNVFDTSDSDWYSVHDNIFDKSCWKCLGKEIDNVQQRP